MTTLFPVLTPAAEQSTAAEMPMFRDVAWDYGTDTPIFSKGAPVIIEGREAVLSWCRRALLVPRYRLEMYSQDYGSELESLIGQPYTDALKQAEAIRYVREALLANPYVESVTGISVSFDGDQLQISCRVTTIYGGGDVNV